MSLEQTFEDVAPIKQMVRLLDTDFTEYLTQNAVILSHAIPGEADLVKAIQLLEREHPAYALVYSAYRHVACIKAAEVGEDCRQKGTAGLFDRHKDGLNRILSEYPKLKAKVDALESQLRAGRLEGIVK